MDLKEIYQILVGAMTKDKVAYDHFDEGKAPALPFVVYREVSTSNFIADGIVYENINDIDVELYTAKKDLVTEKKIEDALTKAEIPWNKAEDWIADEKCYMITYSL